MAKWIIILFLGIILISCQTGTSPELDDVTDLESAIERWDSIGYSNYTYRATRICECLPPYKFDVIVSQGKVTDVKFETSSHQNYSSEKHLVANSYTVNQLFQLIKKYQDTADAFEVEFHKELGYPTRVYINPSFQIADNEINWQVSGLRPSKLW